MAGKLVLLVRMESEGSWRGIPFVHYPEGRPYCLADQDTGQGPGPPQERIRSEGVEDEHRAGSFELDLAEKDQLAGRQPGWLVQQHGRVPRLPCVGFLPPSCGLSILCGSP